MSAAIGPLLGFSSVLLVAVITHFFAEDYRRHRDATALAAALSGELKGHFNGALEIHPALEMLRESVRLGLMDQLHVRKAPLGSDPIFDANAAKLGTLGVHLSESVAYVYQRLSGFRIALDVLLDHWNDMDNEEKQARLNALMAIVNEANTAGKACVLSLQRYAATGTLSGWIGTFTRCTPSRNNGGQGRQP